MRERASGRTWTRSAYPPVSNYDGAPIIVYLGLAMQTMRRLRVTLVPN